MNKPHLEMLETEYLVVGAGAAGCAFGFLMERAGADVLLLEMKEKGWTKCSVKTSFCYSPFAI